jgi:hypothetical protein
MILSTPDVNEATLRNHLNQLALVRDTTLGPNTIRYTGDQHVVMGGTIGIDRIRASEGDDTLWGDEVMIAWKVAPAMIQSMAVMAMTALRIPLVMTTSKAVMVMT